MLAWSLPASENDLLNKRLKLDYEEITPCLKEVTAVWEKMLSTPGRSKIKCDMEKMHSAVGQGKLYQEPCIHPLSLMTGRSVEKRHFQVFLVITYLPTVFPDI
jgi:hypothetical protein